MPTPGTPDPSSEWVGLAQLGGNFGWTARYTGSILTRLKLREKSIPVAKIIEFDLARNLPKNGKRQWLWNEPHMVALLQHLGVPVLTPLDKHAWKITDEFFQYLQKARVLERNKKTGVSTWILKAVVVIMDGLKKHGDDNDELLVAIDRQFFLAGVESSFRENLYLSMGKESELIMALSHASILDGAHHQNTQPARARRL